ncbi:hypothetical protein GOZ81_07705 [Agrobacterium vitis]|uniref:acyl-CoA dehydrogenase family protein n=1 Tax=Agrobacterium vitis TaxID=373 RepID=UPI0012E8452D|nr:acyl-CoA dehydrogenase family protein [Agrobacterium vitis]MVA70954.1 hypothetical protein [Agrobacterium vitis]
MTTSAFYLDRLRTLLGDPLDDDHPFSFATAVKADLTGDSLDLQATALVESGFIRQIIPAHWKTGGELVDLEAVLEMARLLAGRNPSLMPRLMYSIGAITVLDLAGTEAQRKILSDWLLAGHSVALAVNEPGIRSDLINNQTKAERQGDWYVINGRKWLVGQAEKARALMVMAKTGAGGPAAFSLFLIDRQPQWESTLPHPRAELSGMKGIDVADVDIDVACVNVANRVGGEGEGIELVFRAESVIKLLSIGAMLGPCESALRLTYGEIAKQANGGHPHQHFLLAGAYADYRIMDSVAKAAARFASFRPQHFPVAAAVAKQIAQEFSSRIFTSLMAALGARSVLAEEPVSAILQKLRRDGEVAQYMDINPQVNLGMLANQLPSLTKRRTKLEPGLADALFAQLQAELSPSSPCPAMVLAKVPMLNRAGEPLTDLLPGLAERFAKAASEQDRAVVDALHEAEARFASLEEGMAELLALRQGERPEAVNAGAQFARLYAVSCCALSALAEGGDELLPFMLQRLLAGDRYAFSGEDRFYQAAWHRLAEAMGAGEDVYGDERRHAAV